MFLSNLQLYACNLQGLRTEVLTILILNKGVFVKLAAVCWQPTGLKDGSLDMSWLSWHQTGVFLSNLHLYVGNLQDWRTEALTILTSNRSVFAKLAAVCWQPTGLKDGSFDNLDIKQGCFCQSCSCILATYRSLGLKSWHQTEVFCVKLAAVRWLPTGHKDGSLDIKQGWLCQTCICMLATYRAYGQKSWQSWHQTGVFLWNLQLYGQPTGLKDRSLDNLDIKHGCFCQTWSCMLATYRS